MGFVPVNIRPGIRSNATKYDAEGAWFDCDKIRFVDGRPENIGGWQRYSESTFLGSCRALFNWVTLDSANYLAVGTNLKYYLERGQTFNDITPIRRSVTLGTDPFATTSGSAVIRVSDTGHGATDGDFVTFTGATGFNNIPADELNAEHQITWIDANSYDITVTTLASATGSGGGASVDAEYQINTGQATATSGDGWGSSTWSRGTWGSASSVFVPTAQLRVWTQTNFGEDLVFNTRGAAIYYWDASGGVAARAVDLSTISGANQVPTVADAVLFTESRHLVAFGANPIGSAIQDPLFIRWASQESLIEWSPSATNTAGGQRLSTGSYYVSHLPMKQEVLVWTDSTLYSMQYVGAPYTFTFTPIGENVSIAGPNAAVSAGDIGYWMGKDKFYFYNGRVQTLVCDVWDHVFRDINPDQLFQTLAGTNEAYNEIIWYYCSSGSLVPDRYVIFNYVLNIWYYGSLTRTAWIDSPLRSKPLAAGTDGYIYWHETGLDDGSTSPPSAINAYIESGDADLGEGDVFMFIRRIMPDVKFTGSTDPNPSVTMTVKVRRSPGGAYPKQAAAAVTRTATIPVEQFTEVEWVRLRGRQAAFRIESNATGVRWKLGKPRIDAQPDGGR